MRAYNIYSKLMGALLLLVVTTQLFVGCERRPMEEEVGNLVNVPFKIDWSQSGLDVAKMHRATIRVFPHDGTPAYDFRLQENKEEVEMLLPIGKYSFIIFNETTDAEDWKTLVFKEIDNYDQFMVTTLGDAFRGLYTRAEGEKIQKSAEALASWGIDEFEVTKELIAYTRAKTRGANTRAQFASQQVSELESQLGKLVAITPLSAVKTLNIVARVENLVSAQRSSGAISGATEAVLLKNRKPIAGGVTHIFVMNGRQYDDPAVPKHGTIHATIFVFNVADVDDLKYELTLDFLLNDGTPHNPEVFDITKELKKDKIEISIDVGSPMPDKPDDRPIVLPEVAVDGKVEVDDWEKEVIVPIG